MDPNANLEMLMQAIAAGDFETAREYEEYLAEWLRKGGFLPSELQSIADDLTEEFSSFYNGAYDCDDDNSLDFRVYIRPDGAIELAIGDASYDTDHRGFCGAGCVCPADGIDNCRAAVLDCFNDAIEMAFQSA